MDVVLAKVRKIAGSVHHSGDSLRELKELMKSKGEPAETLVGLCISRKAKLNIILAIGVYLLGDTVNLNQMSLSLGLIELGLILCYQFQV